MRAVNSAVLKIQQVGAAKLGQQGCVQARPDTGLGPVPKPAPGRHTGAADQFGRHVAPGDAGPQYVHHPSACRPVVNAQSPGVAAAPLRSGRQERNLLCTKSEGAQRQGQGLRDDGRGHLQDVLPDGCGAVGDVGDTPAVDGESWTRRLSGCE